MRMSVKAKKAITQWGGGAWWWIFAQPHSGEGNMIPQLFTETAVVWNFEWLCVSILHCLLRAHDQSCSSLWCPVSFIDRTFRAKIPIVQASIKGIHHSRNAGWAWIGVGTWPEKVKGMTTAQGSSHFLTLSSSHYCNTVHIQVSDAPKSRVLHQKKKIHIEFKIQTAESFR